MPDGVENDEAWNVSIACNERNYDSRWIDAGKMHGKYWECLMLVIFNVRPEKIIISLRWLNTHKQSMRQWRECGQFNHWIPTIALVLSCLPALHFTLSVSLFAPISCIIERKCSRLQTIWFPGDSFGLESPSKCRHIIIFVFCSRLWPSGKRFRFVQTSKTVVGEHSLRKVAVLFSISS